MTTSSHTGQDPATPAPYRRWVRRWLVLLLLAVGITAAVTLVPDRDTGDRPATVATADLAAARAKAGLRPCPPPVPGGAGPAALRGVWVSCLGDGTTVDVGAVLAGQITLVNLWASWCEVCREELRALEAYTVSLGAVPVLGVQILSAPDDGLELLAALGVHLPSVLDADGAVALALRAPAYVPVSYLVSGDGTVRQVLPPTPFRSADEVARTLRAMASGAG